MMYIEKEHQKSFSLDNLKRLIIDWNNNFNIDYLWRKKYSVPFNSSKHREVNLIDIKFEFEEDKLIAQQVTKDKKLESDIKNYKDTGNILKKTSKKFTEEELDEIYNDLDIDAFTDSLLKPNDLKGRGQI